MERFDYGDINGKIIVLLVLIPSIIIILLNAIKGLGVKFSYLDIEKDDNFQLKNNENGEIKSEFVEIIFDDITRIAALKRNIRFFALILALIVFFLFGPPNSFNLSPS